MGRDLSEQEGPAGPGAPLRPEVVERIFRSAPYLLYLFDIQTREARFVNRQVAADLGYTSEQATVMGNRVLEELVHPDDLKRLGELFGRWEHAAEGAVLETELRLRRADGTYRWLLARDTAFSRDANGRVREILGTALDITERKEAQEELDLVKRSVDRHSGMIFWANAIGQFIYVNNAACAQTGYSREELLRMSVPDVDTTISKETWPLQWARLKQDGSAIFESRMRRKDGSIRPIEVSANYLNHKGKEYDFAFVADITERKAAQGELDLVKRSVDRHSGMIFWVNAKGAFTYVNDAACKLSGYTREELLRMSVPDVDPLWTWEQWPENWARIKSAGSVLFESQLRCKDGSIRPIEVSANYLNHEGKEYNFAFVTDITERKAAETALRESEEKFRLLAANIPGVVYLCRNDERYSMLYLNELVEEVTGYPVQDFLADRISFVELYHPDDAPEIGPAVDAALAQHKPFELRYRIRRRDGKWRWIHEVGVGVFLDGRLQFLEGFLHDVTGEVQASEALWESEERYALAVAGSSDGIWDWNILTGALFVSDRFRALLGYVHGEPVFDAEGWHEAVHPDDRERNRREIDRHLADRLPYDVELRMRTRPGPYRWFRVRGQAVWTAAGKPTRMAGSLTDITSKKEAEEQVFNIAKGVSAKVGEDFFHSLVEYLARSLAADIAFVGAPDERAPGMISSIACYADGKRAENFSYALAGTPCADVLAQDTCVFPSGVQERFPKDKLLAEMGVHGYAGTPLKDSAGCAVGLMVVLYRRPIENRELVTSLLQIFAARAAAEFERTRAEKEKNRLEAELRQRLQLENEYLRQELDTEHAFGEIVGRSAAIQQVTRQIELVAPTDATVLILGETGTGKELVARAIHQHSVRRDRPFIKVSCGAIPKDLFESEFFGHVKGAFTGAIKNRLGRFQLADGGTLFLDEVGEIPFDLQSKLLRVLQEGTFERVGESVTRAVNVRVMAATHRDLRQMDSFREDLYYRLSVFPIEVAPLRERLDDIPMLAQHFVELACARFAVPIPKVTQGNVLALQAYSWPGNVRELQNVIERAVIIAKGGSLRFELATAAGNEKRRAAKRDRASDADLMTEQQLKDVRRERIQTALKAAGGKIYGPGGAAELLGVKPSTLSSRIRRMGIRVDN
ncbi:MAG: PAS domain S-box protein [Planctomycetaceae bacterium]|nr:PAS domain S-box protein [Planctomycetota bacterium]NUN51299.1 PAS domain S-box protein [Planctomycetaceae bacterium]